MPHTLHYGHDFDNGVFVPATVRRQNGAVYLGPGRLLLWLEGQLGRAGFPENNDYLRIELYRQSLGEHLSGYSAAPLFGTAPFYNASFRHDPFAVATALLGWRDELLVAGWNFNTTADTPPRLKDLGAVEAIFTRKLSDSGVRVLAKGVADRYCDVLNALRSEPLPLEKVVFHEPEALQTPLVRRLVAIWREQGIPLIFESEKAAASPASHLGWLQLQLLTGDRIRLEGKANNNNVGGVHTDTSLVVLRARRDSDAAAFLAQLFRKNPEFKPVLLHADPGLILEQALVLEGLPAPGLMSASLARPSLQVLKLAPAFLWEPVDVFKIMEFVNLQQKPLENGLSQEIARVLAAKPGLNSDVWFAAISEYLENTTDKEARKQYDFWFERRRYPIDTTAPKRDAISIYQFLRAWALQAYSSKKESVLLVLAEQARRIVEMLEALPETRVSFLELERIVRTVYEASPIQMEAGDAGRLTTVSSPGSFAGHPEHLIWWNCVYTDTSPPPDYWRKEERQWLATRGIQPANRQEESARRRFRYNKPVLATTGQLILVMPEQAEGVVHPPSLLLGDIEAAFGQIESFCYNLDEEKDRLRLQELFDLERPVVLDARTLSRPLARLPIRRPHLAREMPHETPTQLEALFYYPHKYYFRNKLEFYPASLFTITRDETLKGNLAHRFLEMLLRENCLSWSKNTVFDWVEDKAQDMLSREGATLLLYGREPERKQLLTRIKNAAWSLISLLRSNGWQVIQTEMDLDGLFCGVSVRAKADLVVQREASEFAVIDFKWSGANRRRDMIRNGQDLQLVFYSRWIPPAEEWAHSGYFILEDGKMIARTKLAFREAITPAPCDDHRPVCLDIYQRMEKTYRWRLHQLQQGELELRTARTAAELEAIYDTAAENLLELLEMKREDNPWDDYSILLGF